MLATNILSSLLKVVNLWLRRPLSHCWKNPAKSKLPGSGLKAVWFSLSDSGEKTKPWNEALGMSSCDAFSFFPLANNMEVEFCPKTVNTGPCFQHFTIKSSKLSVLTWLLKEDFRTPYNMCLYYFHLYLVAWRLFPPELLSTLILSCTPLFQAFPSLLRYKSRFHREVHTVVAHSTTCFPLSLPVKALICVSSLPHPSSHYLVGECIISSIGKMGWKEMREWYCYFRKH